MNRKFALASVVAAFVPALSLAPAVAAPAFEWTGMYVGIYGGYGWGQGDVGDISFFDDSAGTNLAATIPGFSADLDGGLFGAEFGYNWRMGPLVAGAVADIATANIHGGYSDTTYGYTVDTRLRWLSTVRASIGVPVGRFLLFGTAGVAIGGGRSTLFDDYGTIYATSATNTHVGWTAGAGVAAALTANTMLKIEYLHVDLGSKRYDFPEDPSGSVGWPLISANGHLTTDIVRASIDWRW